MVAAVIGRGLVAAAMVLPWLILLPLHGIAAVLADGFLLAGAFHGAGLVVGRLANQRDAPPLLVAHWGVAALISLSGVAIAVHAGTLAVHTALVFGFAAVHTGSLGARFAHHADRVAAGLAAPRGWMVPAVLLAVLGALAVLVAAGAAPRPFDDEGHVLAQLRRVLMSGSLGDAIGYPRDAQLGAQIALGAVAAGADERFPQLVDALALVLALALAVARIRAHDPGAALWAVVLIVTAFALAIVPTDPVPIWPAVGLMVALYTMLSEPAAPPLPLAITAGALIALRYELAPVGAAAVLAAWWHHRGEHRRTAVIVGGALAAVLPFVVARVQAWHSIPAIVHAIVSRPPQAPLAVRLLIAVAVAVPAALVLRVVVPDRRGLRAAATPTAIALGAVAGHLTAAGAYSQRLAWPIAIAFGIILVIELARSAWSGPTAPVTMLVLGLLIYEGREARGRLRLSRRIPALMHGIDALRHPPGRGADPYREVLASVPAGATVAVWVAEPERLDYARHRIVDLRTPMAGRLRVQRWGAHASKLDQVLAALQASFLLVEGDDAQVQRTQTDLLYRLVCATPKPGCADDLEAIALTHRIAAHRDNLQLVDLRP